MDFFVLKVGSTLNLASSWPWHELISRSAADPQTILSSKSQDKKTCHACNRSFGPHTNYWRCSQNCKYNVCHHCPMAAIYRTANACNNLGHGCEHGWANVFNCWKIIRTISPCLIAPRGLANEYLPRSGAPHGFAQGFQMAACNEAQQMLEVRIWLHQ